MKLQLYKLLYTLLQRSSTDNMNLIMKFVSKIISRRPMLVVKFVIFTEKVLRAKIPFSTQFWRIIVVCIFIL